MDNLNEFLTPTDIKMGIQLWGKNLKNKYLRSGAKFARSLENGSPQATAVYNTINGGILPAIDMAGSTAVSGLAKAHIDHSLPFLPIPGKGSYDRIKGVIKDTASQKADKVRDFVRHPIKKTAEYTKDVIVQPWMDLVRTPALLLSRGPKKAYSFLRKMDNVSRLTDEEKFMSLPKEKRDLLYKTWQARNQQWTVNNVVPTEHHDYLRRCKLNGV